MRVCSYGGGTNSTALIVEAVNRGIKIDHIVFADTGSEMPHTYQFLDEFDLWLRLRGLELKRVRWVRAVGEAKGAFISLHEQCLKYEELPSKAYGFAGCTDKWKQAPIEKFVKSLPREGKITRWVGYYASEPARVQKMFDKKWNDPLYDWEAPLFEWGIDREGCISIIQAAGLSLPGKSSCFMCPSMKKHEILDMGKKYPELLATALLIEDTARPHLSSMAGLGRKFSWRDFVDGLPTEAEVIEGACGCHDDSLDREED
jgi:hypothetical protein